MIDSFDDATMIKIALAATLLGASSPGGGPLADLDVVLERLGLHHYHRFV